MPTTPLPVDRSHVYEGASPRYRQTSQGTETASNSAHVPPEREGGVIGIANDMVSDWVEHRPLVAVAIAAGVGGVIGWLVKK